VPDHDPVYKVSIIPRGRALGVTMFLPEEDRYSLSRQSILSQICSLYGGRIAEELTLGKDGVTTGASNDIQRATEMARNMVTKWGLSDELGPLLYSEDEGEVFLGRSAASQAKSVSSDTAVAIDHEVRRIIDECYARATKILTDNRHLLDLMKDALMEYETIDQAQINEIMEGKKPGPPADWSDSDKNDSGSSSSSAGGTAEKQSSKEEKSSPIGGPASEH
jgi:cell division protease FtsH